MSSFLRFQTQPRKYLRREMFALVLLVLSTSATGCVSRRMTFVSNPPGAMVLLEGREIGYSPASADFLYYGTRQVTMIKDGYETKTELVTVPAPWYQWPVIEFFADNFSPRRVTDRRVFSFDLAPKKIVPDEELRARARQLRSENQIGQ
ncbi:PEGA domain-containing protein [Schlesneria paludicola]|uniref:PEGA domain-containing protein n=1 Tax=Schlesneria paludicola TaxID=360056 RepID=UPI00029B3AE4|nr:PEGA domain-containing protein [Schlesneria paludicola]